jgi:hypothetical protein
MNAAKARTNQGEATRPCVSSKGMRRANQVIGEAHGFGVVRPAFGVTRAQLCDSVASSMVTRSDFTASPWIWQMRGSLTPRTFAISR